MEKLTIGILAFLASNFAFGVQIPSYQDVLDAQVRCDPEAYKRFSWMKGEGAEGLDMSVVGVVSRLNINELPPQNAGDKSRLFLLNYVGYADFVCGARAALTSEELVGQRIESSRRIVASITNPSKIVLGSGHLNYKNHSENTFFLSHDEGGLNCVVYIDDLVKNPNIFPLDNICRLHK